MPPQEHILSVFVASPSDVAAAGGEQLAAIPALRGILSSTQGHIEAFRDAVDRVPRLTADLNKAKLSVKKELAGFVELLRSQQQMLADSEAAAASVLGEPRIT